MFPKHLVWGGFLSGIMATQLAAQPSIIVDLVRDNGGIPVLSQSGNWQWSIDIQGDDAPSSLAVEIGIQVDQLTGLTPGDTANIWNTPLSGAPVASLTGGFDYAGSDPDGFQVIGNEAYISVGSSVISDLSNPIHLATIEAGRPHVQDAYSYASTDIDILGAYQNDGMTIGGNNAIVAQDAGGGGITIGAYSLQETRSAIGGDADLSGIVTFDDFERINFNFGNSPAKWTEGDFNHDNVVDIRDAYQIASPNFGRDTPSQPIVNNLALMPNGTQGDNYADLYYDPVTGNLTLDSDLLSGGFGISGLLLHSESGIFTGMAAALPEGGLFHTDTDTLIGVVGNTPEQTINLGPIAETGLSVDFLLDDISYASVGLGLGSPNYPVTLAMNDGLPGDYNQDGTVNAADYVIYRNYQGQNYDLPNRKPGVMGPLGPEDYSFWVEHFGNYNGGGSGGRSATDGAVPEPGSAWLLIVGAQMLARAHRRRRLRAE